MVSVICGIILGALIGFTLTLIAYKQQLPKWQQQGFARGKTPQEKELAKNYIKSDEYKKGSRISSMWFMILFVFIVVLYWVILVKLKVDIQYVLVSAALTSVITLIGGFISTAFLVDGSVRKFASRSKSQ